MNKTKVAIVVDTCMAGGVSKALNDFIKCLYDKNLEITLLVRKIATVESFYLPSGVLYEGWPQKKSLMQAIKKEGVGSFFELIYNKINVIINKRNFQRSTVYDARQYEDIEDEYDCVIGYQMISNDVTIMSLEKIKAKRKVLWLHGKKNFAKKNLKFFDNLYSKADLIVAVSKDTEDRFKSLIPKCKNKTITIHNFYDFDLINSKADECLEEQLKNGNEILIVSTGRISKEKGFDRVPDVAKRLVDEGYRICWYIAGDGALYEDIKSDVKAKGLDEYVRMVGYQENPYPYVKQCDIYVQPSYTEGFCTSTMEAKILKRPVVTTDVPGMNEQFTNGVDGLIVESSVDGIYNGIKRLIDDKQLYDSITQNLQSQKLSNDEEVQKALKAIRG